ncbi:MAG: hypothetical protein QM608_09505, partial [Caulobacter sp.]
AAYQAGDRITVSATLWDPQDRPADAYHVVAHLVSAVDPSRHLQLVLHPTLCRGINLAPPSKREQGARTPVVQGEKGQICIDFGYYAIDAVFERAYNFGPVAAAYWSGLTPLRIAPVPGGGGGGGLFVPDSGVVLRHSPAPRVLVRLAHESDSPIRATAFDAFGREQDAVIVPAEKGQIHHVVLKGEMITQVQITGGDRTAVLERYCFFPAAAASAPAEPQGAAESQSAATALLAAALIAPTVAAVESLTCTGFSHYQAGTAFPDRYDFGDIEITALDGNRQLIVDWPSTEPNSLLFSAKGIRVEHAAVSRVALRVGQFTRTPLVIQAFDAAGQVVASVTTASPSNVEDVQLAGPGITAVEIRGGGNEAILVRYCIGGRDQGEPKGPFRRCFRGAMSLPADAPKGRWIVYLAVQNVNHVPPGVAPEKAATIIGGHVMGPTADALGCGFMLLGDHVFDIF